MIAQNDFKTPLPSKVGAARDVLRTVSFPQIPARSFFNLQSPGNSLTGTGPSSMGIGLIGLFVYNPHAEVDEAWCGWSIILVVNGILAVRVCSLSCVGLFWVMIHRSG